MKTINNILIIVLITTVQNFSQDKLDFTLDLVDGESKAFSEIYPDGPLLVNFWALWCKPCRTEMKALVNLYAKYSADGFQILGINQDTPRSLAKVRSFVESHQIDYLIALDPNKEIFEMYNGQVIPLSILYDKEGNILYQSTGYLPGDEFKLEEEIVKALEVK